jgi:hypothetical protein
MPTSGDRDPAAQDSLWWLPLAIALVLAAAGWVVDLLYLH